jgi:hypothetical protein
MLTDKERETAIDTLAMLSQHAHEPNLRRYWFALLKQEIANRTPEQIRAMEIAKGLRAA